MACRPSRLAPRVPSSEDQGPGALGRPFHVNYSGPFRGLSGRVACRLWRPSAARMQDSYLVDSASSHMLVSKIKPCMSKYKQSIL